MRDYLDYLIICMSIAICIIGALITLFGGLAWICANAFPAWVVIVAFVATIVSGAFLMYLGD